MTEQEIIQLHKELYEYLTGIHEIDASFRFIVFKYCQTRTAL